MTDEPRTWTDDQLDRLLGNLLRVGVVIAGLTVLVGGIVYVMQHGEEPRPNYVKFGGERPAFESLIDPFRLALQGEGRAIIMVGVILLIATPIMRVVFSVFAFAIQRDWKYVLFTLIVLSVLLHGLLT